jgi:hypothetical protein
MIRPIYFGQGFPIDVGEPADTNRLPVAGSWLSLPDVPGTKSSPWLSHPSCRQLPHKLVKPSIISNLVQRT